jgi:hypothetical protein
MGEPFVLDGQEVDDNVLCYWSIASISRALRLNAEAQHQKSASHVLASVAGYYSLFHLGIFLLLSAPHLIEPALRRDIGTALKKGGQDPSRVVTHTQLCKFLDKCQSYAALPATFVGLFNKAKELREYINYGPDLLACPEGFRVLNRKHHPQEIDDVLGRTRTAFVEAVEWASQIGSGSKLGIPFALSKAAAFFVPNEDGAPYYSEWSSSDVLSEAEELRELLEHRSQGIVHPKA